MIIWQPIETAPKDGRSVLLTNGTYAAVAEWYTPFQGEHSSYWLGFPYVTRPTHWAPINLPGDAQCKTCKFMERDCYGALPAEGVACVMWKAAT